MEEFFAVFADRVVADLDHVTTSKEHFPSRRLGPSKLGHECPAYVWHYWHWTAKISVKGARFRVIESAVDDERRLLDWLKIAGWNIKHRDERGEQLKVRKHNGHVVAKVDGIGAHTAYFGGKDVIIEAKAKSKTRFNLMRNPKSFREKEPQEYAQAVYYADAFGLDYTLHINYCRDDGQIYPVTVESDPKYVAQLNELAESAMNSTVPLAKLSNNPTYFKCKNCEFVQPCHFSAAPPKSCRSCQHCKPAYDVPGEMYCSYWRRVIPEDFLTKGCDNYLRLI